MNRRRVFNICLSVLITATFALLAVFVFSDSYLRFGEAVKDFGLSVGYYFCTLFGIEHNIVPSVTEYSSVMNWDILLPSDFEGFTSQSKSFFALLIDGENFAAYWSKVGDVMLVLLKVVAIILPACLFWGWSYGGCTRAAIRSTTGILYRFGYSRNCPNGYTSL